MQSGQPRFGFKPEADRVFISAQFAARMIADSGVGEFDNVELKKKLTGKVVRVSPYIYEHSEGVQGSASPQDRRHSSNIRKLVFRQEFLHLVCR